MKHLLWLSKRKQQVTSHVEVWIETRPCYPRREYAHVTSHVEVWIETLYDDVQDAIKKSPPTWRCGLKPDEEHDTDSKPSVTSHVEVWIETRKRRQGNTALHVTSHVEVWIETDRSVCHAP